MTVGVHTITMKVLLLLCFALALQAQKPVKVSVYYESLCPDSMDFIKNQLYPTWLQLTKSYIDIDFVPYGKASQNQLANGTWTFTCQHGPPECTGNMEQACALSALSQNATAQVMFISCVMSTRSPQRAGQQCATVLGIDYTDIQSCINSGEGGDLLSVYGDRTHSFRPPITFVPTVAFNDVYTVTDQDDSMSNLLRVVCRHINGTKPVACATSNPQ